MESKSDVDVESLQKRGARSRRWLDCCLVLSVTVLFVGLAVLAAAGFLVVRDLQSKLPKQPALPQFEMSKYSGSAPTNTFKMQNFAYLEASTSALSNQTMEWKAVNHRAGHSVGSNYEFNQRAHSLKVKQTGRYFLYVELNVTCFHECKPGLIRVQVSEHLRCEMRLFTSSRSEQKQCWTVATLTANTTLLPQMSLPEGPMPSWRLELRGSGYGLFLVG